ncbi:hypothetical protein FB45DRAFT_865934 [Roridomyces roridus]|uniref:Uncharacterized protein n=1 Tax=Roridomyces roridus TaxID=1738132 RepID=A0AAD7C0C4_9AGAR|nr:hypothetical protein FB45DRAFT_865934 [Roridomyces roridus]
MFELHPRSVGSSSSSHGAKHYESGLLDFELLRGGYVIMVTEGSGILLVGGLTFAQLIQILYLMLRLSLVALDVESLVARICFGNRREWLGARLKVEIVAIPLAGQKQGMVFDAVAGIAPDPLEESNMRRRYLLPEAGGGGWRHRRDVSNSHVVLLNWKFTAENAQQPPQAE